jgi:ubiquinone/menaquinone biosynthesis C-methylase UbiE
MMFSSLMRLRARRVSDYLSNHIKPGGSLLDLGCGDGSVASCLGKRLALRVSGADVVLQRERHIPVVRYDGISLPFRDSSFDTVMLIWVLHHAKNPGEVLREAARVSRGRVLVMECCFTTPLQKRILGILDYMENRPSGIPVPLNFRSVWEWRRMFREAKLEPLYHNTGFRVHWIDPTKNVLFSLRAPS